MAFGIGDRVRSIGDHPCDNSSITAGDTGIIVKICSSAPRCGVRWDAVVDSGHRCNGTCDDGHGWFVHEDEIELIDDTTPFEFNKIEFEKLIGI